MEFTREYNHLLKEKWDKYIVNGQPMPDADPEIRSFVYDSWKRSKMHGIPPFEVKDKRLSEEELKQKADSGRSFLYSASVFFCKRNELRPCPD